MLPCSSDHYVTFSKQANPARTSPKVSFCWTQGDVDKEVSETVAVGILNHIQTIATLLEAGNGSESCVL
jgi:hypothetical protein